MCNSNNIFYSFLNCYVVNATLKEMFKITLLLVSVFFPSLFLFFNILCNYDEELQHSFVLQLQQMVANIAERFFIKKMLIMYNEMKNNY